MLSIDHVLEGFEPAVYISVLPVYFSYMLSVHHVLEGFEPAVYTAVLLSLRRYCSPEPNSIIQPESRIMCRNDRILIRNSNILDPAPNLTVFKKNSQIFSKSKFNLQSVGM